jgi:hypothetical protein
MSEPAAANNEAAAEMVNPFTDRVKKEENSGALVQNKEPILIGEEGMILTSYDQMARVAYLLHSSRLVPRGFQTVQQVMVALLRAKELKLPPLQALEGMTVVNNKIGLMGDLALALVERSGQLESKKVRYTGEGDSLVCTVTLRRVGREAQTYTFSIAEAKAANLAHSSVWKSYPKRMTYYRALGFGLRDEFSDILKGMKTTEELMDYPDTPINRKTEILETVQGDEEK